LGAVTSVTRSATIKVCAGGSTLVQGNTRRKSPRAFRWSPRRRSGGRHNTRSTVDGSHTTLGDNGAGRGGAGRGGAGRGGAGRGGAGGGANTGKCKHGGLHGLSSTKTLHAVGHTQPITHIRQHTLSRTRGDVHAAPLVNAQRLGKGMALAWGRRNCWLRDPCAPLRSATPHRAPSHAPLRVYGQGRQKRLGIDPHHGQRVGIGVGGPVGLAGPGWWGVRVR
jgi:hypothetical protein